MKFKKNVSPVRYTGHTYPPDYPPGYHWTTDEGWRVLDCIKPGVIGPDGRAFLCGLIAGMLSKVQSKADAEIERLKIQYREAMELEQEIDK